MLEANLGSFSEQNAAGSDDEDAGSDSGLKLCTAGIKRATVSSVGRPGILLRALHTYRGNVSKGLHEARLLRGEGHLRKASVRVTGAETGACLPPDGRDGAEGDGGFRNWQWRTLSRAVLQ